MFDVAVIGGGVCGCSLLYALSRYQLKVVLLEKENDIGVGTTKANSAIMHAGYDPEPGTIMARCNVEGNRLIQQLCKDLDILYNKIGSLVLGFSTDDEATLQQLYERGVQNGVPGLQIVNQQELRRMEPNVSEKALFALYAPSTGVVNPWELASAQAEVAVQNGAQVWLRAEVLGIERSQTGIRLQTGKGDVEARFVINAAGVHTQRIANMAGDTSFTIRPDKGEYFLLDKSQGKLVNHVVFQCPTPAGKGVLVSPTVHGNLIVGPNNQPVEADDTTTSAAGLASVQTSAFKSVPAVNFRENIRNFAGVRAASDQQDFIVGASKTMAGFYNMAGIKSPGLTAAPALAQEMVQLLAADGLELQEKDAFCAKRQVRRFKHLDAAQKEEAIRQNPLYGKIVCRCETVTEGEIVDALHRPLAPQSLDGVKRRCATGMGRCQGGFCGPRVQAIIARELGIPQQQVPQDREGMQLITSETKQPKGSQ